MRRLQFIRPTAHNLGPSAALRFVLLLGVVSLFADMTYEGGRSLVGPFLAHLGTSATVVGVVAGLGELLGYGLRLISGYVTDRTGRYWPITIAGYAINLLAIPALAFAGRWEVAAGLVIVERIGKAIRTPARDAMLADATQKMGHGWGFGLHEAMDQIGALIGPLIVTAALFRTSNHYPSAFTILLVPAILSLLVLLIAYRQYPRPSDLAVAVPVPERRDIPSHFWIYLAATALVAAGYADFPLVAYHFAKQSIVPTVWIPLFYAIGMGMSGVSALVFGRLFDRFGLLVVAFAVVPAALFAPFVFLGGVTAAIIGMALWGIGMGVQESVVRAAIATMVPPTRRGAAYGTFGAVYGGFWFLGSALMGALYDQAIGALVAFSVLAQLAAVPLLIAVARRARVEQ